MSEKAFLQGRKICFLFKIGDFACVHIIIYILMYCTRGKNEVFYRQKDCVMTLTKYTLFFISMLALAAQVQADSIGWLSWEHTAETPYTFLSKAGKTIKLPSEPNATPEEQYLGWSVFNAPNSTLEEPAAYEVSAATDAEVGEGMLRFNKEIDDEQTFLSLGISTAKTGAQDPVLMDAEKGEVRVDNVCADVRFVECADLPNVDTLKKMYPSYADSLPTQYGEAIYTAAKLGVCVGPDGYFYVARVRAGATLDTTTGLPEDYVFEFCQSPVSYAAVGGGKVTIRIEFNTYLSADEMLWRRAFRIFAKNANNADAAEMCLTTGLGYPWKISDAGDEYQFDFQSLGKGEWLYSIDDAVAASGDMNLDYIPLDALNRLAFSATSGGFYSAWLTSGSAQNLVALAAYDAKQFAPYVAEPGTLYSLYTDWATKYNVALTDYLEPAAGGISLYGAENTDKAQKAFDAFLLYMDPETNEPLRLTVTGIVPEEDQISFTVMGPDGCDLREAVTRAARLCIRRAATLDAFATAPVEEYEHDIAFSADGTAASFVLPKVKGEVEMPFMQATLVAITDAEVSTDNE